MTVYGLRCRKRRLEAWHPGFQVTKRLESSFLQMEMALRRATRLPSRIRGWDSLSRGNNARLQVAWEGQAGGSRIQNQPRLNRSQKTVAKQQKAILRLSSQTSHDAYLCSSRGPFPSPTTPTDAVRCAGCAPGPRGTPSGGKPGHREPGE